MNISGYPNRRDCEWIEQVAWSKEHVMNINRFSEGVSNYTYATLNSSLGSYIDVDVLRWLIWLLTPVFVSLERSD